MFRPVYDRGSKARGDRRIIEWRVTYPKGTWIQETLSGRQDVADLSPVILACHTVHLPGDFPAIEISTFDLPGAPRGFCLYVIDQERSSREQVDRWYWSQMKGGLVRIDFEARELFCHACKRGLHVPEKPLFDRVFDVSWHDLACLVHLPGGREVL
jgi:hypothetical protein